MHRYLKLYGHFLLMRFKILMEYRVNFIIGASSTILLQLAGLLTISTASTESEPDPDDRHTGEIAEGKWTANHALGLGFGTDEVRHLLQHLIKIHTHGIFDLKGCIIFEERPNQTCQGCS